ncbi:hypothetical protein FK85_31300, partial [Halorubrum saccharovorum]
GEAPPSLVASVDDRRDRRPDRRAGAIATRRRSTPTPLVDAFDRHDAYPLLDDASALLRTGPTGTNVNDLRAIVVEKRG